MTLPMSCRDFTEASFLESYPVHRLCRFGDTQSVEQLLRSQPLLAVTEEPYQKWTPAHWAAFFGHLDCLRQVASFDPSVVNMQSSRTFQTPLHCAATNGHTDCVLWLLQAGSNPEVKDSLGEAALHKAVRSGETESIRLLTAVTTNINCRNMSGETEMEVAPLVPFMQRTDWGFRPRVVPMLNSSRKRTRDTICDDDFAKRLRPNDAENDFDEVIRMMDSSVTDHARLCHLEMGYRNTVVECMLSEYHGC